MLSKVFIILGIILVILGVLLRYNFKFRSFTANLPFLSFEFEKDREIKESEEEEEEKIEFFYGPQEIEEIKEQQKILRKVTTLETGKPVDSLGSGIYGFVYGFSIERWINDRKYPDLSMEKNQYKFEVQKINDNYFLVGYIGEESYKDLKSIKEGSRVNLTSIPSEFFKKIVTIPFSAIQGLEATEKEQEKDSYVLKFTVLELKTSEIFPFGIHHQ